MVLAITISITLTLLAIALLLLIVDVFFASDVLSLIAYAVAAVTLALHVPTGLLGMTIAAIILWFVLAILHYALYRKYVFRYLHKRVAPHRHRDSAARIVGSTGNFRRIDGVAMIDIEGDLWPAALDMKFTDGEQVRVHSLRDGMLTVSKA